MLNTTISCFLLLLWTSTALGQTNAPHLARKGTTTQLIVEGKPFIVLGGELGNSTATSMANMASVWPKLKALHLNTVLIPVYWELIEAEEGQFDFSLYQDLILEARQQELKIIFLWFGCWKNSMSSHAPAWVKLDQEKYPRVQDQDGRSQEILSPFSEAVLQADRRAFERLMAFIKAVDEQEQTVIMVQVENEIGMLPSARDHQAMAQAAFEKAVPQPLMNYLKQNRDQLMPEFLAVWEANGFKSSGNWEAVFGQGLHTDEIFMAWHYARFTDALTTAGKKVYELPMFVNAALNRPGRAPGEYPSAGPLPHILDVWKAAGSAIDFYSPDFYNPDFAHWCDLYTRQGNPLFVPEHAFDQSVAAKALFAIGHYEAIGFSPFSIESKAHPEAEPLGKVYELLDNLSPLISDHQGQRRIYGVLLTKTHPETVVRLGNYELSCKHDYTLSWTPGARTEVWPEAGAVIVQTGENEFFVGGTGVVITVKPLQDKALNAGLLKVEEGRFEDGNWTVNRHLNGDQTHQGRHVSIPVGQVVIQKVRLYLYH